MEKMIYDDILKMIYDDKAAMTDEQATIARWMRQRGASWKNIAKKLGVPHDVVIRRCDRVLARKTGLTAPGWLYGYKSPRRKK